MSNRTRYAKPFDDFEIIRRKAYRMIREGNWTLEEASAWIEQKDAELEGYSDPVEPWDAPPQSTRTPDKDDFPSRKFSEHIDEWNIPSDGINRRKF